jgi:hypothetical protein
MDSSLAASMKPQVLTMTTSARAAGAARWPAASSRRTSASESASFFGQPSVWMKKAAPVAGLQR